MITPVQCRSNQKINANFNNKSNVISGILSLPRDFFSKQFNASFSLISISFSLQFCSRFSLSRITSIFHLRIFELLVFWCSFFQFQFRELRIATIQDEASEDRNRVHQALRHTNNPVLSSPRLLHYSMFQWLEQRMQNFIIRMQNITGMQHIITGMQNIFYKDAKYCYWNATLYN